jgi:dihydrofolate reductase
MRKLKLQMQMTIDGFVAGPNGELDWMEWNWSDDIKQYVTELTNSLDTILLGRKMTDGFISHWTNVTQNPDNPEYAAAKIFVDTPKVVFTRTLNESKWANSTLAKGNLTEEVNKLKAQNGKDIIVYGGAGFVSSLIKNNLIDEYYLFTNPTAIGKGLEIFKGIEDKMSLNLVQSHAFECSIVLNKYVLK